MPNSRSLNVPGTQSANTVARVVAGLAGAGSKNVTPMHKPSKPAAHTVSPIPGKEPKSKIQDAEAMLDQQVRSGKIKDLEQTKAAIAKKTGVWPNGATN